MTVNKSVKDEDYLRKNDWFLPFKFVDVLCSLKRRGSLYLREKVVRVGSLFSSTISPNKNRISTD